MSINPNWVRDELILALDLYFKYGRTQLNPKHPQVIELSGILNSLPIHSGRYRDIEFRNPNGVSMKLGNFLSLDPQYEGVGLSSGGKLDREVWDEFADTPYKLHQIATAIRATYEQVSFEPKESYRVDADDEVFPEGKILTRLHKLRERNPRATKKKKDKVLAEKGRLLCEVCDFDFFEVYGELGEGFAECHHIIPIAELGGSQRTKLSDLAIVCANCHRMLHRSNPMLSIRQLREIIISTS